MRFPGTRRGASTLFCYIFPLGFTSVAVADTEPREQSAAEELPEARRAPAGVLVTEREGTKKKQSEMAQPAAPQAEPGLEPHLHESALPPAREPTAEEMRLLMDALAQDAQIDSAEPGSSSSSAPANAGAWSFNFTDAQNGASQLWQSMNPDISLILDVAGAWFGAADNFQLGAHDPNQNGFTFQQLELATGASVDPFFRFDANLVFSPFGVEVEEAYATSTAFPANLQLRAGQFLTRFGRVNPTHPHTWSFVDQPWILGKMMGPEGNRGLGAEISWLLPLPWFTELIVSGTDPKGACCARSFWNSDPLEIATLVDVLYTVSLKQFFPVSDDNSLLVGLSGQTGPNATGFGNRTEIFGADFYWRHRPVNDPGRSSFSFQGEGLLRRRQIPNDVEMDSGYYVQAVYQFGLQYEVGIRSEGVSGFADSTLDPNWSRFGHRHSVQATFYPSHFSRVRLQSGATFPPNDQAPFWSSMVNFEVLVGAHGSHPF